MAKPDHSNITWLTSAKISHLSLARPTALHMKILHTADWHLGKRLHKQDLSDDHAHFLHWLMVLIRERGVEVLLISGDVFDLANPGSEACTQYYESLVSLRQLGCQVVITGGNHDSPAVLNAPREVLRTLDIHVVGGLPADLRELLIPLPGIASPEVVVAAVPYLRDSELRRLSEGERYEDRIRAIQEGITRTYAEVAATAQAHFPGVPLIGMGHLFAAGASTSDSERDIHIGNLAATEARQFGTAYQYMALGHIHRPQQVKAELPVYYSGSPIPLSFSELRDEKRVLLLDTEQGWQPESIPVPSARKFHRIVGSLAEVRQKVADLPLGEQLPSLVEVEVREAQYDPAKVTELDRWVFGFESPGLRLVKHRIRFEEQVSGTAQLYQPCQLLEDLQPAQVFARRLEKEALEPETAQTLREAFQELLETVQNQQDHENQ